MLSLIIPCQGIHAYYMEVEMIKIPIGIACKYKDSKQYGNLEKINSDILAR